MPSFTAHGPSGPVEPLPSYTGLHRHLDLRNGELGRNVGDEDVVSWPLPDRIWMKPSKPVMKDTPKKKPPCVPGVARVLAAHSLDAKRAYSGRRWKPPPIGADLVTREPVAAGQLRGSFPPHVALPEGYTRTPSGKIVQEVKLIQTELSSDSFDKESTRSLTRKGSKILDTTARSSPVCNLMSVSEVNVMKKGLLVALLLDGIGNIALFRRARVSPADWDRLQPPETARKDIEALEVLPDTIRSRRLLGSVMMGRVSLHQLLPIDVSSIQGDLPHLSLEQLLMFRINNSPTSSYNDVHTGLLFKVDCLLAARLGEWVLERVMFQLFSPYLAELVKRTDVPGRMRQSPLLPWLPKSEKKERARATTPAPRSPTHSPTPTPPPRRQPPGEGERDSCVDHRMSPSQKSSERNINSGSPRSEGGDRCHSVPVRQQPVIREGLVKDLAAVFGWRSFSARGSTKKGENEAGKISDRKRATVPSVLPPSSPPPLLQSATTCLTDGSSPKLGEESQEPRTYEPKRSSPGEAGAARGRLEESVSRRSSSIENLMLKAPMASSSQVAGGSPPQSKKSPSHFSRFIRRVQDSALLGHKRSPAAPLSPDEAMAMRRLQEARDLARVMVEKKIIGGSGDDGRLPPKYLPSAYPMPASTGEAHLAQKREIGRQVIQQLGLMMLAKEKKPELFPCLDMIASLLKEDPQTTKIWSLEDFGNPSDSEEKDEETTKKSILRGMSIAGATRLPGLEEAAARIVTSEADPKSNLESDDAFNQEPPPSVSKKNESRRSLFSRDGKPNAFCDSSKESHTGQKLEGLNEETQEGGGARKGDDKNRSSQWAVGPGVLGIWIRLLVASSVEARCNSPTENHGRGVSKTSILNKTRIRQAYSLGSGGGGRSSSGLSSHGSKAGGENSLEKNKSKNRQRGEKMHSSDLEEKQQQQPCSGESTESETPGGTPQPLKGSKMKKKTLLLGGSIGRNNHSNNTSGLKTGSSRHSTPCLQEKSYSSEQPSKTSGGSLSTSPFRPIPLPRSVGPPGIEKRSISDQQGDQTIASKDSHYTDSLDSRDGWCECFIFLRLRNSEMDEGGACKEVEGQQKTGLGGTDTTSRGNSPLPRRGLSSGRGKGRTSAKNEKESHLARPTEETVRKMRLLGPGVLDVLISDERPIGTGVYWGSAVGDLICKGRQSESAMWRIFWIPEEASLEQAISGDSQAKALIGELRRKLSAVALRRSLMDAGDSPNDTSADGRSLVVPGSLTHR